MLAGLDALVFDVQDAGVRFYTYATTMAYAMEEAARHGISFFVLDRPNPIDADVVQGPVLDPDLRSFTGYHPLPVRHGMTIGELARLFNAERRIGADLHVITMDNYRRGEWYDETGLPWIPPSPNLRSLGEAALYPAVALLEGANLSVGRGTATPFEVLGAPWVDGRRLASHLSGRPIAGVRFEATEFVPEQEPFEGRRCRGVRFVLTDREQLDAPLLGVELANALRRLHGRAFRLDDTLGSIGSRRVVRAIDEGEDPRLIARGWEEDLASFLTVRRRYLLY
jgi:uncharacterized protein YbbC (DUF1343 family)